MKQLNKIEAEAASRALGAAAKKISAKIPVGEYSGEVSLRVRYTLTKDADYDTAPTVNLLSKAVLAKAMVMAGIQADNFLKCLRDAAIESLGGETKLSDELQAEDERVAQKLDALFAGVIAQLPRQPRSGDTSVKAIIEVVDPAEVSA